MTITAKYVGACTVCGKRIDVGDTIEWAKGKGSRHAACKPVAVPKDAIRLGGGSGYGYDGWHQGQVVAQKQKEGGIRYLYVLSASSNYVREDGMSCGVGDEEGYYYSATCRIATPEEAAPVIAQREAATARKAAKTGLEEITDQIRENGEKPEGDHSPDGERLMDTQDIYGGGDWFVIEPEWIWYVRNNGSDGSDWSANNVRTGGAGAIGWRVPFTDNLAARLRQCAAAALQT